ncbi:class A beta-lactamase [Acidovorax sp. Be4]|uniref:Beta-lactamase n=1 Tax=Acidovorax bellezanensis TaxID=2976702 RepID=A0ABT2PNZ0_9BURK|nr:class A beta-lactamase [Acidovorax sp. Be4]MCT9812199.1 class A beta-lactamase [Acidovorax sp. Be4]
MERRPFIRAAGLAAATFLTAGCATRNRGLPSAAQADRFQQAVRQIEIDSGGRLGVAVLDTHSGLALAHRGTERFPMCSTFKFLAAGLVLSRVDRGQEQLSRRVAVQAADLVEYSPVTQPRVGGHPMSMAELCDAAVTRSDNTAANLLLQSFGGPQALTAYARTLGDEFTRLDRMEPDLNQATPGDPRDTTTPQAMLRTLQKVVLGDALSPASRDQMTQWLLDNKTGGRKLRAQLPAGWRVGDKTGGGAYGTNNDVGVLWPPGRAPVLVTSYLTQTAADQAVRDRALAEVGRLVASLVMAEAA